MGHREFDVTCHSLSDSKVHSLMQNCLPHLSIGNIWMATWSCFFFFNLFFKKLIYFNWRLITLQYCSGFCSFMSYIDMNQPWAYMCPPSWTLFMPPSPSHPSGSSQCTSLSTLPHASNLNWRSVSHMIIYTFQCYSLRSSHPHLLPQSPKDCSIWGSWFLIYQFTLPFFLL